MTTDNFDSIRERVHQIYPNACEAHVKRLQGYGSKLGLHHCLCCCKELMAKIGRHVFVEARTDDGMTWTFEKVTVGIIVQVSETEANPAVRTHQSGRKRSRMERSVDDEHPKQATVEDILKWIITDQLPVKYHVAESNCIFFAHGLFVEFANKPYPIAFYQLVFDDGTDETDESLRRSDSNRTEEVYLEAEEEAVSILLPFENEVPEEASITDLELNDSVC